MFFDNIVNSTPREYIVFYEYVNISKLFNFVLLINFAKLLFIIFRVDVNKKDIAAAPRLTN